MIKILSPIPAVLARGATLIKDLTARLSGNGAPARYPIWKAIHQPDSEHLESLENALPAYWIGAKPGVSLKGIDKGAMTPVLVEALLFLEGLDKRLIITSGLDGKHSTNSLHYVGRALDIRTRHLQPLHRTLLKRHLKDRLGPDYDVVLEKTHLHVEYDPK